MVRVLLRSVLVADVPPLAEVVVEAAELGEDLVGGLLVAGHRDEERPGPAVARMALVSHFVQAQTRFHETNVDVTYSRYRRRGDLSLDESFFPIVWEESTFENFGKK